MIRPPPRSPLFPYPTLFRSSSCRTTLFHTPPGARTKNGRTTTATTPAARPRHRNASRRRSEEHTSELQSPDHLVCRLLLEKKKNIINRKTHSDTTSSITGDT